MPNVVYSDPRYEVLKLNISWHLSVLELNLIVTTERNLICIMFIGQVK